MKIERWIPVLAFCTSLPAWGAVQFFNYEIKGYPVTKATCQVTADQFGQRLGQEKGLEIYQTTCSNQTAVSSDIKITYVSEEELTVESTEDQLGFVLSRGIYKSRAACEKDLSEQSDHFRRATGLQPFVAFCNSVGEFADEPYDLRIEAFGDTSVHPYLVEATFFKGKNIEDSEILARQIRDLATKQGVDVAFSAIVREWPYYKVVLRYYGDKRISLAHSNSMTFDSAAHCTEGKEALEKIYQKASFEPLALFCSAWAGNQTEIALNEVSLHSSGISQTTAPDQFSSLSSCVQKLPQIEAFFRTTLKKNVVGSHCDGVKGTYHANVFTRGSVAP